jgi:hypothetical protein
MLVRQQIQNLLNGVSQQPDVVRSPSQAKEQINALSSPTGGLRKRPPTEHLAVLPLDPATTTDAFLHVVDRDVEERYIVVVVGGVVRVFDVDTGVERTVSVHPDAEDYLDGADKIRALTIGDNTILVNTATTVQHASAVSPQARNEAVVFVRQADFSTDYKVSIGGVVVGVRTVDANSPNDRSRISTLAIADELTEKLRHRAGSNFRFTQYGSSIHIERVDGADFRVWVSDGLADQALRLVKGSVQKFEDLPQRARPGMVVEVVGDPGTEWDNYYLVYDDTGTGGEAGVWRETLRPETLTSLDAKTLPVRLRRLGMVVNENTVGTPVVPDVASETHAVLRDGFDTNDVILTEHAELVTATVPYSADLRYINFTLDTTTVDPGTMVEVRFSHMWSGTWGFGPMETRHYPGGFFYDFQGFFVENHASSLTMAIELRYGSGATPERENRRATLVLPSGSNSRMASIETFQSNHRDLVFDPNQNYPQGAAIHVTMVQDQIGTAVVYTTPARQTGAQVAEGLRAVIDATTYTATMAGTGRIRVTRNNRGPQLIPSIGWDAATRCWLPQVRPLDPGALVGKVAINQTNGASATITANTSHTLTTAALPGGARFNKGDVVVVKDANAEFIVAPSEWHAREAGDLTTAPWPSFVGKKIQEVFFFQNRLGFITGETVVMSATGDLFNFFRHSARSLRADDYIDVTSAHHKVSNFHTALPWNRALYLFSDHGPHALSGDPVLTPTTVRLDPVGQFPNSPRVRPVEAAGRLFMARDGASGAEIVEFWHPPDQEPDAATISAPVPSYIKGSPVELVCDDGRGFLGVLTDADRSRLYIYSYHWQGDQKVMASWSHWRFPPGSEIIGMASVAGKLTFVVKRSSEVSVERLDLSSAMQYL